MKTNKEKVRVLFSILLVIFALTIIIVNLIYLLSPIKTIYSLKDFSNDGISYFIGDGIFYAFNSTNGYQIWNYTLSKNNSSEISIAKGDMVIYIENDNTLYALNSTTGVELWIKSK